MAANEAYDLILGNNGYLLARADDPRHPRSWVRKGTSDIPRRAFYYDDGPYGHQPDEFEFASVFNDFSGGFGHAYRHNDNENTILFSSNMDCRFPKQAIHTQQLQTLPARYASAGCNVDDLFNVPLVGVPNPPAGASSVLAVGKNFIACYTPTGLLTAGSQFDFQLDGTGSNFTGRPATFGSYTYIGVAAGNFIQRGFDGTNVATNLPGRAFLAANGVLARLHQKNLISFVAANASPGNVADWSATYFLGNGQNTATDLINRGDQIFVSLDDGLYAGDKSGTFYNVLPEVIDQQHPDNGRDITAYNSSIIYTALGGVYAYDQSLYGTDRGTATEIGPQGVGANRSPVRGRQRGATGLGRFVYTGLWTGSQSYLLAGESDSNNAYRWHVLNQLPHTAKFARTHFDAVTSASGNYLEIPTRMWVATDATWGAQANATAPLYVAPIPRGHDNPLLDMTFSANYCGSARLDLPADDRQQPGTTKIYRAVEVWADNLASGSQYADVYYQVDQGARTLLGRAQTSPYSVLLIPGSNGMFVSGQNLALSVESFTASASITPVYRAFVVRGAVRPKSIDVISAVIRVADHMVDRRGGPMPSAAQQKAALLAMAPPNTYSPVPLVDLAGLTQYVMVLPAIDEEEVYQAGRDAPELNVTVKMVVASYTSNDGVGLAFLPFTYATPAV